MHCSLWYDGLPVNEPMSAASWETSQWLGKLLCEVYLRIKRTCNICMVVVVSLIWLCGLGPAVCVKCMRVVPTYRKNKVYIGFARRNHGTYIIVTTYKTKLTLNLSSGG